MRIFEYQKCLLHQKVMTVDGVWCAIGSSNFDDRSFETNDEITLGLCSDRRSRSELEAIFERDVRELRRAEGAHLGRARARGTACKDNTLYVFNELL